MAWCCNKELMMDDYNEKFNAFFGITDAKNEKYISYKGVTKEQISFFIDAMANYSKNDYRAIHDYLDCYAKSALNVIKFYEKNHTLFNGLCVDVFNNLLKIKHSHRVYDNMHPHVQQKYDRFDVHYLCQLHPPTQQDIDMCKNTLRKYGDDYITYGIGLVTHRMNNRNVFDLKNMWDEIVYNEKCYRIRHKKYKHEYTCRKQYSFMYSLRPKCRCELCEQEKFKVELAQYVERRQMRLCMMVLHDASNENSATMHVERVLADSYITWKVRRFL